MLNINFHYVTFPFVKQFSLLIKVTTHSTLKHLKDFELYLHLDVEISGLNSSV